MQTAHRVVTEGRDVESAIQAALAQLQASHQEVEIVVERRPRKGLFGLWRRGARVRVTRAHQKYRTSRTDVDTMLDSLVLGEDTANDESNRDGTLTLQAGKIHVTAPVGRGRHPVIRPGKHARVWVNDRPVSRLQVVTPGDAIRVEAVDEQPQTSVRAHVSKDRMTACISVSMSPGTRHRLVDEVAATELTVTAAAAEQIPPPVPTIEDLQAALADQGVIFGISVEALEQAIPRGRTATEAVEQRIPVAFGIPMKPPVDERVELRFTPAPRVRTHVGDGNVDLLGLYRLSSVQPGEILAVVHSGRPGRPGRTVTGQTIHVREPKKAKLRVGDGAVWHPDQQQVLAARGGRPSLVRGAVSVVPKHTVVGDADARTGHVEFHGDVEVLGNVGESMRVVAQGEILIGRGVSNAVVEADEGIVIGESITRSRVVAGARSARLLELLAILRPLAHDLDRLINAVQQVQAHPRWQTDGFRHVTVGRVVKRLLETKFPRVVERVADLLELTRTGSTDRLDIEFIEFSSDLHRHLAGLGPIWMRDLDDLRELHHRCKEYAETFGHAHGGEHAFDVVARHVHNADVWASGKIILRRGGSFYSRMWAGKGVTMDSGVFRGDSITVNDGDVTLDEVGSPLGAEVRIVIIDEGRFRARTVHPGVVVSIGSQTHVFDCEARNVLVRLVDGMLDVSTETQKLNEVPRRIAT